MFYELEYVVKGERARKERKKEKKFKNQPNSFFFFILTMIIITRYNNINYSYYMGFSIDHF